MRSRRYIKHNSRSRRVLHKHRATRTRRSARKKTSGTKGKRRRRRKTLRGGMRRPEGGSLGALERATKRAATFFGMGDEAREERRRDEAWVRERVAERERAREMRPENVQAAEKRGRLYEIQQRDLEALWHQNEAREEASRDATAPPVPIADLGRHLDERIMHRAPELQPGQYFVWKPRSPFPRTWRRK